MRSRRIPFLQAPTRGYSLVELTVVMALVAATALLGFEGWRRGIMSHRANQVMESVNATARNIAYLLAGTTGTTGISTASLVADGVWPRARVSALETATPVVTHEFGGTEAVQSLASAFAWNGRVIAARTAYRYTLSNIPQGVCAAMVNELSKVASVVIVRPDDGIDVEAGAVPLWGNTGVDADIALAREIDAPLDPVRVDRACSHPDTANAQRRQTLELLIRSN